MIKRKLFSEDHDLFRDAVRRFMAIEIAPKHAQWEEQGFVDRELWLKAGAAGYLCPTMPEAYGGSGVDICYSTILMEEQLRIGATGPGFQLHSEIVAPYLLHYGSEQLKSGYLPKMATGEMIGAIAMTEPGAGSDLQGVRTTAARDGEHYILNGSKTFITNGMHCDLVIVVAKTDPTAGSKGISLFVVDTGMAAGPMIRGQGRTVVGLRRSFLARAQWRPRRRSHHAGAARSGAAVDRARAGRRSGARLRAYRHHPHPLANGIVPDVIVGTSIGAVVGGCHAANELDTLGGMGARR